jgi:hypothetical protein
LSIASQSLATQAQVKGYVDANARVALWNAGFCYAPATSAPPDKSSLSLCFGSDGALYLATAISGPGTEAGPKDPVTTTGYWIKLDITVNGIAPDEQRNVQLTYVVTQSEFDALQAAGTLVPGAMYLVGNTTEIGGGWQWLVW